MHQQYLTESDKRRLNREAIAKSIKKDTKHLLPRRKTRRGKRKKKIKDANWQREFDEAMKKQKELKKLMAQQKQQRGQMFRDFERLIGE